MKPGDRRDTKKEVATEKQIAEASNSPATVLEVCPAFLPRAAAGTYGSACLSLTTGTLSRPHVVLAGGGHASVALLPRAARWVDAGVRVTMLNDHPALYYSGMVPEYLGGVYGPDEVQVDLAGWCGRSGVRFVRAWVNGVDRARQAVLTEAGEAFACDLAVFDIGAVNPRLDRAGPAVRTKPLHHAGRLRHLMLRATGDAAAPVRIAVVGGGAAGVEVALNLSGWIRGARRTGAVRLSVIEPGERLLRGFPAGMAAYVLRTLRERGVEVLLGARVDRVTSGRVLLEGGAGVEADEVLWATGSTGQPLFREAGLDCDERGFLRVGATLQCPQAPWIFAAGDCAAVEGHDDLPRIGVHAVKQGPVLCENVDRVISSLLAGRPPSDARLRRFRPYPVSPLILSTGDAVGLWSAGPVWTRGGAVLRLKHLLDERWMGKYDLRGGGRGRLAHAMDGRYASQAPLEHGSRSTSPAGKQLP